MFPEQKLVFVACQESVSLWQKILRQIFRRKFFFSDTSEKSCDDWKLSMRNYLRRSFQPATTWAVVAAQWLSTSLGLLGSWVQIPRNCAFSYPRSPIFKLGAVEPNFF